MRRRLPVDRLGELLASDRGLSTAQAEERRRSYGPNEIVETSSAGWRSVIRNTATDPMLWFLVGTGALYSFLEEYAEALVLLAAIVPLIGMDAFLHRRTQASTQGLRSRLAARATVVRDDNAITIVPPSSCRETSSSRRPASRSRPTGSHRRRGLAGR